MKTNFQNFSCVRNEGMYRTMRQIQFEKNSLIRRRTNDNQSFSIVRSHLDSTSAQVSILSSNGNSTHSKLFHSGRTSKGLQLGKRSQPEQLRVKKRGINWDVLNEHLRLPKFDRWEKKLIKKLGKTIEVGRIFSLLN